jgi:RNA polymerase sigma factor (sigma-70 family)
LGSSRLLICKGTMLRLWKTPSEPESASAREGLFLRRYERLYAWALQITGNDPQRAEDLVHDAFIQFTLRLSDISDIHNLDGYLYGMLRNIHLAELRRRAVRMQKQLLSVADYDSAEVGLRADDTRDQIVLQDQLRRICHYACVRKTSSKAGSVLILRFFHGYYPGEIAELTRSSRRAVEHNLSCARAEARLYLENPASLRFMTGFAAVAPRTGFALGLEDFLRELQAGIFRNREGQCLTKGQLIEVYRRQGGSPGAIDCARLAHLVSCPRCIEIINGILGLASLSDRYPTDKLGMDPSSRGGSGGSSGGSGGGAGGSGAGGGGGPKAGGQLPDSTVKRLRRRRRNVFEHCPKELRVSVNGYVLGSQKIGLDLNELTLSVKVEEKISFVEVVSEQEVRLLLMDVDEPPPEGAYEQAERVALSDGRMVEATLSFTAPWSTLTIIYRDPSLSSEAVSSLLFDDESENSSVAPALAQVTRPHAQQDQAGRRRFDLRISNMLGRLWSHEFWLRTRTLVVALAIVIALLLLMGRPPRVATVSAAGLLNRAIELAESFPGTDRVVHQATFLEARKISTGELISRRKIDLWRSPEKGLEARRVFDEKGRLLAGMWKRADGSTTIYRSNSAPESLPPIAVEPGNGQPGDGRPGWQYGAEARQREGRSIAADELWRLDLSAAEFLLLIGDAKEASADQRQADYMISYSGSVTSMPGLMKASLILGRDDLHATEQDLQVDRGGELFDYHFEEASIERRSSSSVPPAVFDPEPELLGPAGKRKESVSNALSKKVERPAKVMATIGLEVQVLDLLYEAGADMGEQVSVERTPEGKLRVEAILESDQRKGEILRSLNPVLRDPAVRLEVSTVSEALRQQARRQQRPEATPAALTIETTGTVNARIPVDSDLARYLSGRKAPAGRADEEEVRQYAARELHNSQQGMMHAYALRRLVNRFSKDDLRALDPDSRGKWLVMIRSHAASLAANLAGLRQDLRPVFSGVAGDGGSAVYEIQTGNDADLASAIQQLFDLCSEADKTVRSAFSITPDPSGATAIKGTKFWQSLVSAEAIATKVAKIQ